MSLLGAIGIALLGGLRSPDVALRAPRPAAQHAATIIRRSNEPAIELPFSLVGCTLQIGEWDPFEAPYALSPECLTIRLPGSSVVKQVRSLSDLNGFVRITTASQALAYVRMQSWRGTFRSNTIVLADGAAAGYDIISPSELDSINKTGGFPGLGYGLVDGLIPDSGPTARRLQWLLAQVKKTPDGFEIVRHVLVLGKPFRNSREQLQVVRLKERVGPHGEYELIYLNQLPQISKDFVLAPLRQ